ncbi:MAG: carbohydrate kinase family protein [Chloroflexi bacterium]|nr:carbohydrate kinase family protein [Chloroflexota bacterium]
MSAYPESSPLVVVVGDADMDLFLRVPHLPAADEKVRATQVEHRPGGMAANVAATLGTLGTRCVFMGAVGDDAFGQLTLDDLRARGVDVGPTVVRSKTATYFCVVLLDPSGEKALVISPSGAQFPTPSDLDPDVLARASHVHTTATNLDTALAAASQARTCGATVSLDLESDAIDAGGDRIRELLASIDVLFLNRRALDRQLGGASPTTAAACAVQALGPTLVAITLGAQGILLAGREVVQLAAHSVSVVDSTGAGDCFAGAFIHARQRGEAAVDAARFAAVAAALATRGVGARSALPERSAVLKLLEAARA